MEVDMGSRPQNHLCRVHIKVIIPTFLYVILKELTVYWEPYEHLFC